MPDIRTEVEELQKWAKQIDQSCGNLLQVLQQFPGVEHDPQVKNEWRRLKEETTREFAMFLLEGIPQ